MPLLLGLPKIGLAPLTRGSLKVPSSPGHLVSSLKSRRNRPSQAYSCMTRNLSLMLLVSVNRRSIHSVLTSYQTLSCSHKRATSNLFIQIASILISGPLDKVYILPPSFSMSRSKGLVSLTVSVPNWLLRFSLSFNIDVYQQARVSPLCMGYKPASVSCRPVPHRAH